MNSFKRIHHWLSKWQEKRSSRFILSAILSILILSLLGPILLHSISLNESRRNVYELLTGTEQHIAALQLEETGFIEINGISHGDVRLKGFQILDANNIVIDPASATALVLSNEVPTWAPAWLLQNPTMTINVIVVILIWCLITVWIGLFQTMLYAILIASIAYFCVQFLRCSKSSVCNYGHVHPWLYLPPVYSHSSIFAEISQTNTCNSKGCPSRSNKNTSLTCIYHNLTFRPTTHSDSVRS